MVLIGTVPRPAIASVFCAGTSNTDLLPIDFRFGILVPDPGPNASCSASSIPPIRKTLEFGGLIGGGLVVGNESAESFVGPGAHLGGKSEASVFWGASGVIQDAAVVVHSQAYFRLDDLIFSGPDIRVETRGHLKLSEHTTVDRTAPSLFPLFNATVLAGAGFRGNLGGLLDFEGGAFERLGAPTSGFINSGIVPTNYSGGDVILTTPPVTVPTGVPIVYPLDFFATVIVQGVAQISGHGHGLVDASHSLEFPTDGPVFDLPPGFTVNSADGLIVDNRWVGAVTEVSVPEPPTLVLLASALPAIGVPAWWRHRRRKTTLL